MNRDVKAEASEETPPLIAYRELVYDEAQRLYELAVLLVESPPLAMQLVLRSLDRTWTSLQRRQLYMDIDEAAFWAVVREAAQRRGRSTEVRGLQPGTTSNDRLITAVGIVSAFAPEQAAAVYQVGRLNSSYQFAGTISGMGEQRARDIVFSARQEYREARERFIPAGPECSRFAPLVSARVDGQLRPEDLAEVEAHLATCPVCQASSGLFEDFNAALKELRLPPAGVDVVEESLAISTGRPDQAPRGWRRVLRFFSGPWGLIPFFIVGALILRQCEPAPVDIGVGRTSDLVYARSADGKNIMVLESGSGRELPVRLPPGVLGPNGQTLYAAGSECGANGCKTTLSATDTGTGVSAPIASLDGRLHIIAVRGGELGYLADEDADWNRLVAVRLRDGGVQGTLNAPADVHRTFGPERPLQLPLEGAMVTLARRADGDGLAVVSTDLSGLMVKDSVQLAPSLSGALSIVRSADAKHLYVYSPVGSTIVDIDRGQRRVVRSVDLKPGGGESPFAATEGTFIAAAPDGELLYCVLPAGGIAAVRTDTLETVRELGVDRRYRSVAVSTDGGSIYTLGLDGAYRVLEAVTGKERVSRSQVRADAILQVTTGE